MQIIQTGKHRQLKMRILSVATQSLRNKVREDG